MWNALTSGVEGHKPDLNWLQIELELGRNLLKISGKLIARPLSGLDIPPIPPTHTCSNCHSNFIIWRPRVAPKMRAMQWGSGT